MRNRHCRFANGEPGSRDDRVSERRDHAPNRHITYDAACRAIAAARAAAGHPVSIAVVDPGGHLIAFARIDGAPLLTVDLAVDKAHTAIRFDIPSGDWYDLIKDDGAMLAALPTVPRLTILGGGLPIRVGGMLVGGIGSARFAG